MMLLVILVDMLCLQLTRVFFWCKENNNIAELKIAMISKKMKKNNNLLETI